LETETVAHDGIAGKAAASDVKRLLIFAPNWLGDAVMALPAIADVRRELPSSSTIVVMARPAIAPLFQLVPGISRVMTIASRGAWRDAGQFGGEQFDAALLLTNSLQTAVAVWRAGIAERWGYRRDLRGPLLTGGVRAPGDVHQVEYYQRLVRALGFPSGPAEPAILVSDECRRQGLDLLLASGWDGRVPLAALAPGAAYGGAKRWPPASFAAVAADFVGDGVAPVLIGGPADRIEMGTGVVSARPSDRPLPASDAQKKGTGLAPRSRPAVPAETTPVPIIDLVGRTDLPALAGVLAHCRALITNDSGAMHFAAAAGVPVTAMFGPTNEQATRPLGNHHVVLTHDVWCRPCMLRECPLDHRCMTGITPDAVLAAARRTL